MLEFGCSGLDTSGHPPASNDGDVPGREGIGEPMSLSDHPGCRDSGMWKSSNSKESLNGVGPCPRLMLRKIFCIRLWRCGGRSCSRVSRCTCAAL